MDYTYENSLFHRISEFHYFSELLDNKIDIMIEHPWVELQVIIREKWLTQKAFSSILWKKVSEVNELLKWKRNITIQRDYLLHQTLWTPIKYWILKQVDYDYSLLGIEEKKPLLIEENQGEVSQNHDILNDNKEFTKISPHNKGDTVEPSGFEPQETPIQEPDPKADEDFKKRAKIFKSF